MGKWEIMPARKKTTTQRANSGSKRIAENKHKTLQDEITQPILNIEKEQKFPTILKSKDSRRYYLQIIFEFSGTVIFHEIDTRIAAELANWMVMLDKCYIEIDKHGPIIEAKNGNTLELELKENPAGKMLALAQRNINNLRQDLGQTPKARLDQFLKASTIKSQDVLSAQTNESNAAGYNFEAQQGKHKV